MPAILTTPTEFDRLLEADTVDALALQRPLPDDALRIVAKGERRTEAPSLLRDPHRPIPTAQSRIPCRLAVSSIPTERNARGQYLLWLTETEANRLASLRRRGESYSQAVIRPAMAQD